MANSTNIKIENNAPKLRKEWKQKKEAILYAIGLKWQEIATKVITQRIYSQNKPWKLTGRLRASLSFATPTKKGRGAGVSASKGKDYITSSSKDTVTVGSNVEYAAKVNNKHKFLEDSVLGYKESYKNVADSIMRK